MYHTRNSYLQFSILILCLFIIACNNADTVKDKQIVADPEKMDKTASVNIQEAIEAAIKNNGKIDDTIRLNLAGAVSSFYSSNNYQPVWSSKEAWEPLADSLFEFINHAELEGLFPKDYHFKNQHLEQNKNCIK